MLIFVSDLAWYSNIPDLHMTLWSVTLVIQSSTMRLGSGYAYMGNIKHL